MQPNQRALAILMILCLLVPGISTLGLAAESGDDQGGISIQVESDLTRTNLFVKGEARSRQLIYSAVSGTISQDLVCLSPDERFIALIEVTDLELMTTKLVLIDIQSKKVIDLVLPKDGMMPASPLWSPDSSRLAYVWFDPERKTVELWLVDVASRSGRRLVTEDDFWTVLVYGKTHGIAWETAEAIQFVDDRDGRVYRVTLDGRLDAVENRAAVTPALHLYLQLDASRTAPTSYTGMVKPLTIRNYDGTCWDGYTGLYPDYGGCVMTGPHPAIDMSGGSYGIGCHTPVVAVCTGPIIAVEAVPGAAAYGVCGNNTGAPVKGTMNLGWQIVLRCDDIPYKDGYGGTIYAIYAHLSQIQPGLAWGVWVDKGTKLGEVGSTGYSTGPHLHFQMERDNQPYHPWYWKNTAEILTYTWNPMYFIQAHEAYVPGPTPPPPPSTSCLKPLLRYWNENRKKHFYTSLWSELEGGKDGWIYEGVEGYVSVDRNCYAPNAQPLYRFWHHARQKHLYTTSEFEKELVLQQGFILESIVGYVLKSANDDFYTGELYRCYHPTQDDHFYTTSWDSVETAVGFGYQYESVEAHVFGKAALVPVPVPVPTPEITRTYLPLVLR